MKPTTLKAPSSLHKYIFLRVEMPQPQANAPLSTPFQKLLTISKDLSFNNPMKQGLVIYKNFRSANQSYQKITTLNLFHSLMQSKSLQKRLLKSNLSQ